MALRSTILADHGRHSMTLPAAVTSASATHVNVAHPHSPRYRGYTSPRYTRAETVINTTLSKPQLPCVPRPTLVDELV